ncbi:MAG TPA: TetR/AcrR family transcriptional regulator [Thermoanaerobaculia bacterium]
MAARKATQSDDLWQSFKRQSIQQAVIQLMCREGLPSVTMDRVAQEAGIAKGTIYLHYKDKQELLDDVKNSSLDPMVTRMDEVFASDASPDRKLQTYSQRYLQYFDERRDLFRILLYEREVVRVQSSRYQGNRYKHLVDQTARAIREGVKKRIFREVDDRSIAVMFVEANVAVMNQRLMTDSPRPVEDDAGIIADLFLTGLARSKR